MARVATAERGFEARALDVRRGLARKATEEDRKAADMMAGARVCGWRGARSRSEPSIWINTRVQLAESPQTQHRDMSACRCQRRDAVL